MTNGIKAVLRDVIDALLSDPPEAPGLLDLDRDRNGRLELGLATVDTGLHVPDVGLVDLDAARQPLATRPHHRDASAPSQTVECGPVPLEFSPLTANGLGCGPAGSQLAPVPPAMSA